MTLRELEKAWATDAWAVLFDMTAQRVGDNLKDFPNGLAALVTALARHTINPPLNRMLQTHDVIRLAWNSRTPARRLASRMERTGLYSPRLFVDAYRGAAIGVLLNLGATRASIQYILRLSDAPVLYRIINRMEEMLIDDPVSAKDRMTSWLSKPVGSAFTLYVSPMLPKISDKKWRAHLRGGRSYSQLYSHI